MGTCIYYPFMGTLDKQNTLATLRTWNLIQDNSGPYRVYRDEENNVYHSVTHILKETAPQHTKDALENWLKKSDSYLERDIACERGNLLTLLQNLYSNLQQNLQGRTQTKEVYGEQVMMDWNAVRKKSRSGASKKQLNPHRVLAGVRQATQEVYDHSYWNV